MKGRWILFAWVGFWLTAASSSAPSETDWNQWRGPSRDGVAQTMPVPELWPDQLSRVWQIEVGAGLSSPVASQGRIYLMTRDGDEEVVRGFHADDGQTLWRRSYSAPFFANSQAVSPSLFPESRGRGPFATPVVHEGRLITLGVNRVLSSFDLADGRLVWQRRLYPEELPEKLVYVCPPCNMECDDKEYHQPGNCPNPQCPLTLVPRGLETTATFSGPNYYGAASSPLIDDGIGFVNVGNAQKGYLLAFNPLNGKDRWVWEAPAVSSSSPVVAEIHGVRQLVVLTRTSCTGIGLDGRLLWDFPIPSNAQIVTPTIFEDLVVFAGYRGPVTAVRIGRDGQEWTVEEAWHNPKLTIETNSPIRQGDRLLGFFYSRRGQFAAIDLRSGATLWESEGRQARGAALLLTSKGLLAATDTGELRVIDPSGTEFRPVKTYPIADSPVWAYPAVIGSDLVIKDATKLTRWTTLRAQVPRSK